MLSALIVVAQRKSCSHQANTLRRLTQLSIHLTSVIVFIYIFFFLGFKSVLVSLYKRRMPLSFSLNDVTDMGQSAARWPVSREAHLIVHLIMQVNLSPHLSGLAMSPIQTMPMNERTFSLLELSQLSDMFFYLFWFQTSATDIEEGPLNWGSRYMLMWKNWPNKAAAKLISLTTRQ